MKRTIKKSLTIILSLVILAVFTLSVYAVQPRYTNTQRITLTLTFPSGTAKCTCKIVGNSSVTSINNGTMQLLDSSGNPVATWSNLSARGNQLIVTKYFTNAVAGETYTLTITANVNTATYSEPVSHSTTSTNN